MPILAAPTAALLYGNPRYEDDIKYFTQEQVSTYLITTALFSLLVDPRVEGGLSFRRASDNDLSFVDPAEEERNAGYSFKVQHVISKAIESASREQKKKQLQESKIKQERNELRGMMEKLNVDDDTKAGSFFPRNCTQGHNWKNKKFYCPVCMTNRPVYQFVIYTCRHGVCF